MKKIYKNPWYSGFQKAGIGVLVFLGAIQGANAQVSAYGFSQSTGTYAPMSGGTNMVLSASATSGFDTQYFHNGTGGINGTTSSGTNNGFPIGFNFYYNGTTYDGFFISTDGTIKLGSTTGTAVATYSTTPISSTTSTNNDLISAFGVDLVGGLRASTATRTSGSPTFTLTGTNTGMASSIVVGMRIVGSGIPAGTTVTAISGTAITMSANATASSTSASAFFVEADNISYSTTGTSGSRVLTVQWKNCARYDGSGDVLNFQIKLFEGTNQIQTIYNNVVSAQSTIASTVQVGLKGAVSPMDYNNRTGNTWAGSVAGTTSTSSLPFRGAAATGGVFVPDSGLTYTWIPPSCISPSGLSSSSISTNAATISWVASPSTPANGYEVYYSTVNTAPTSTTVLDATNSVVSTTTSGALSGLASNTTYYVWVRSACSATEKSGWSLVGISFKTLCNAFTVPYTENFDTTAVGSTTNTNAPSCWKYLEPSGWAGYGYVNTYNTSSPNGYYIYSNTVATGGGMLVSPITTNLSNGNNRVRFMAVGGTGGVNFEIGTLSDPNDPATFVAITSIPLTTTFAQYTVNIPAGTNQYLAFRHAGYTSTGTSIRFDDINVQVIPSCTEVTSVAASTITNSSASISWVAPTTAPANGYEVYYSTTNTAPTTTTVLDATNSITSTTNTGTISGLTSNTTYYVWVRSVCSSTDKSVWSASTSFVTQCDVIVPSYTNDFATFPGSCWKLANGGSPATSPGTGTTNYWVADGFLNSGSTGAARINLYSINRAGWLISPAFNLSAGGYQVKFDYGLTTNAATTTSAMGSDDVVQFVVSTDGGTTWTVLQTWTVANAPSNTPNTFVYNLSSYTGANTKFAIFANDGTVNDSEDFDFFVDNFVVEAVPSCAAPTSLVASTITATSATVSWSAPTTAPTGGYDIYYSTTNTAPTATSVPQFTGVTTLSQVIPGTAGTTYYAWVRSNCGSGSLSSWTGPLTYKLLNTPPANDDCLNAITLTVNPDLNCGIVQAGNTLGATDSGLVPSPCFGTPDDDVWYKFTAVSTGHNVKLTNVVSTGTTSATDMYMQVFSGACGTLTSIACSDPDSFNLTNLTPGQTYYVRVYTYGGVDRNASFNICVGTLPPPPANDNCSGAIALTPGNTFAQHAVVGTNVDATLTSDATAITTCQTTRYADVWYSVVVPANGSITIETNSVSGSTVTDTVLGVYSGTCGNLTLIECDDDDSADGNFSLVSLTGQTPGATLLVGVWNYSSTTSGQFQISAYDSALSTSEVSTKEAAVKVYPNPFADVLNISDVKNVKSVSIIDIAGRLVKTIEKPSSVLHLGELNSGMYMVVLNMNDGSKQTIKAIKK